MNGAHQHPRPIRPALAMVLLILMALIAMSQQVEGQGSLQLPHDPEAVDFWKYAITQGGLTLVVLALGWSYKRDMERWSAERLQLQADLTRERDAFQQARIDDAIRSNRTLEGLTLRSIESSE